MRRINKEKLIFNNYWLPWKMSNRQLFQSCGNLFIIKNRRNQRFSSKVKGCDRKSLKLIEWS